MLTRFQQFHSIDLAKYEVEEDSHLYLTKTETYSDWNVDSRNLRNLRKEKRLLSVLCATGWWQQINSVNFFFLGVCSFDRLLMWKNCMILHIAYALSLCLTQQSAVCRIANIEAEVTMFFLAPKLSSTKHNFFTSFFLFQFCNYTWTHKVCNYTNTQGMLEVTLPKVKVGHSFNSSSSLAEKIFTWFICLDILGTCQTFSKGILHIGI